MKRQLILLIIILSYTSTYSQFIGEDENTTYISNHIGDVMTITPKIDDFFQKYCEKNITVEMVFFFDENNCIKNEDSIFCGYQIKLLNSKNKLIRIFLYNDDTFGRVDIVKESRDLYNRKYKLLDKKINKQEYYFKINNFCIFKSDCNEGK